MFLHQLGDDLVLVIEFGLELLDPVVLGLIGLDRTARPNLESPLKLLEDLPDPVVDLARLSTKPIRKV